MNLICLGLPGGERPYHTERRSTKVQWTLQMSKLWKAHRLGQRKSGFLHSCRRLKSVSSAPGAYARPPREVTEVSGFQGVRKF